MPYRHYGGLHDYVDDGEEKSELDEERKKALEEAHQKYLERKKKEEFRKKLITIVEILIVLGLIIGCFLLVYFLIGPKG